MIAALLILTVPLQTHPVDRCDLIEINHFHDDCGKRAFTQHIFWRWRPDLCRMEVIDWRMVRGQRVQIDHGREDAFVLWSEGGQIREVRAPLVTETVDQFDPELCDREILPREKRRLLTP